MGVKHLNPRQGITTLTPEFNCVVARLAGVKHLNPRQGITTWRGSRNVVRNEYECETPKSPPGDYNGGRTSTRRPRRRRTCVKHLNPRQGITTDARRPRGKGVDAFRV